MSTSISATQQGFSAVELLITLFIGFLFVTMGYQLYSVSAQVSGDVREQSKASDIAYSTLRSLEANPTSLACPGGTVTDSTIDGSKAVMTRITSCPIAAMQSLKLVTVRVKYNVSQKEVSHGMYIYKP